MCEIISFPSSCIVRALRALEVAKVMYILYEFHELVGVSLLNWVNIHDNYHN